MYIERREYCRGSTFMDKKASTETRRGPAKKSERS